MAEKPEDLNLPAAVITRMIKEVLPDGINISKEARAAISKSASVFVLYATSCANNQALKHKRKTLTANDVFEALEDMEFESFIEPLKESLEFGDAKPVVSSKRPAILLVRRDVNIMNLITLMKFLKRTARFTTLSLLPMQTAFKLEQKGKKDAAELKRKQKAENMENKENSLSEEKKKKVIVIEENIDESPPENQANGD